MKKLIVLMIVLIPVQVWAGAHLTKSEAKICKTIREDAFNMMNEWKAMKYRSARSAAEREFKKATTHKRHQRKKSADLASIYTAFCK